VNISKGLVIIIASILLAACQTQWSKAGASQQDFAQDKYQCLQESQQASSSAYINPYYGAAKGGSVTNRNLYNSCMEARGYRRE